MPAIRRCFWMPRFSGNINKWFKLVSRSGTQNPSNTCTARERKARCTQPAAATMHCIVLLSMSKSPKSFQVGLQRQPLTVLMVSTYSKSFLIIPSDWWLLPFPPYASWLMLTTPNWSWPFLIIPNRSHVFLLACFQVLRSIPDHSSPFLNMFGSSSRLLDMCKYSSVSLNISRCFQLLPNTPKYSYVFPGSPEYSWTNLTIIKHSWIFIGRPK